MKIGILGGTFDPVHSGHLMLAKAARDQFDLDQVLLIPASQPPHKLDHKNLTSAAFRYRMAEMAVHDEPGLEVSDAEFSRPGPSYTVDTLRHLHQKYPQANLFLILGADILPQIPQWKEPDVIRSLAELLVAPRPDVPINNPFHQGVHFISIDETPVSASELRKRIGLGQEIPEDWMPARIQNYVRKMKLYRNEDPCRPS